MAIATIVRSTTTINDGFGAYNDTVTGILVEHTAAGTHGVVTATSVNALTLTAATTGFTIAGGTTSKTLTLNANLTAATLADITAAEADQIEAIGATTISATQWGYLGACTAAGGALLDDAAASNQRTTLGLGTIATQAANSVDIDGGAIDGAIIGANSAAAGIFVALTATGAISFDGGAFTFNTSEADLDFRVAASSITNALFVQGSDGFVGINEAAPGAFLHVTLAAGTDPTYIAGTVGIFQNNGDTGDYARVQLVGGATGGCLLQMGDTGDADEGALMYTCDTQILSLIAGTNEGVRMSNTGVLSVDADGDGTGLVTEFDKYDDALVLQEMCHSTGINGTLERKQKNREKLVEMGVFETTDRSHSGYMMKLQPMVRLLAGGIYQNRNYNESLENRVESLENKLLALEA